MPNFDRQSADPMLLYMLDSMQAMQASLTSMQASVAALNTHVHDLLGNGQPGRLQRTETELFGVRDDVRTLWESHSKLHRLVVCYIGAAVGALWVVRHFLHI